MCVVSVVRETKFEPVIRAHRDICALLANMRADFGVDARAARHTRPIQKITDAHKLRVRADNGRVSGRGVVRENFP